MLRFSVNCHWGPWTSWSSCLDSCAAADGTGFQTRTRKSIEQTNGGIACNLADGTPPTSTKSRVRTLVSLGNQMHTINLWVMEIPILIFSQLNHRKLFLPLLPGIVTNITILPSIEFNKGT